jgi:photosystem II stability/assembly factor-like uncharacterized protein
MKFAKNSLLFLLCLFCSQTVSAVVWQKRNSNTLAWLRDVYFLDEKRGWIAGSDGTFLETADGGENWRQRAKFTSDTIRQVYFFDEQTGWLLCERNVYNRGTNLPSYVLRTRDGGKNWEKLEFADTGRERVAKIIFSKNGDALAFGEGGVIFSLKANENSWKKTSLFTKYLLLGGTFTGESSATIVGAGGSILFTENGSENWEKAGVYGDNQAKLSSVFFINPKTGWTVGTNGKIFHTFNGGKVWREQVSGISKNLNDVFFINTAEGFAVGDEGAILHTMTAGNVWIVQESKARHKLEKLFFAGKKGFAVGFGGTILTYN